MMYNIDWFLSEWWQGSTNLESIQILKKPGGSLKDSFLDEGYIFMEKLSTGSFDHTALGCMQILSPSTKFSFLSVNQSNLRAQFN